MIHIHNYESGSNHQSHLQSLYLLYYLTQLMYVACTCTDLLIEKNRKKQYFHAERQKCKTEGERDAQKKVNWQPKRVRKK